MQVTLDQPLIQQDNSSIKYGGFWQRLGAIMLDLIILSPITFGLSYFNVTSWKSPSLLVLMTIISLAYKPIMEFAYGATLGKKVLKLKVTNLNYEKADLGTILLRNVFHLAAPLIMLFFTVRMFTDPDFQSVSNYQEYLSFSQRFTSSQYVSFASGLITIIDAIVMVADQQKRSLHDRIAGTLVIETA